MAEAGVAERIHSQLKIQTSDGSIMFIDGNIFTKFSEEWMNIMMEFCNDPNEDPETSDPIKLEYVSKETLESIMKWATYHAANYKPEDEIDLSLIPLEERASSTMSDWDKEFISAMNREQLMNILSAADFLHIQNLIELGCKQTVLICLKKTAEQVRDFLGVYEEFTPEELEMIEFENKLLQED